MLSDLKLSDSFNNFIIYIILVFCCISVLNGDRIKSKIYKPIDSKLFCFRRMNGTHQIGCNTKESGNVGVIYMINTEEDMTYVLEKGSHFPYIPVITPKDFNLKIMDRFKRSSDRINGILIIDFNEKNRSEVEFLSPDKSCPNEYFDLYVNDSRSGHCKYQQWNSEDNTHSEGLMFNDWPFPIFLIKNQTNIDEIRNCLKLFGGSSWPLCSVQLEAPMNAAKDSVTCLRRTAYSKNSYSLSQTQFCDPLGGYNIFNTLFETSRNETINNDSIIVLSARLDSFSMFDNLSPGADSALTSVVTLLSVADTLTKLKNDIKKKTNKSNVLFALFDGEAFDYIGSSRVLYDMESGKFPTDPNKLIDLAQIRSNHFSHFIELSQMGRHQTLTNSKHQLWIHKNNGSDAINHLQDIIKQSAKSSDLEFNTISDANASLPPSSLQTFLKKESSMAGVVVTNHKNQFSNKFYNSFYDDFIQLNKNDNKLSKTLTDISTVISKTIYQLITNESMPSIESNETLVERLLECYLKSPFCQLFKYVSPETSFQKTMDALPTYVGVFHSPSLSSTSRYLTYALLSYLTGDVLTATTTKEECTQLNMESQRYSFLWTEGSTCVRSQAIKLDALSPAFNNYGTDGHISDMNLYSSWTESQWKSVSARMFLMPGPLQQWLTLMSGTIILFLSFFTVYILDKKSSLLFNDGNDMIPPQTLTLPSVGC